MLGGKVFVLRVLCGKKTWNKPRYARDSTNVTGSIAPMEVQMKPQNGKPVRTNWLFEIEPYSRSQNQSLAELRDNIRLKKMLKRAVRRDVAPLSLIESIRSGIRA